jgi:enterochelin esterase-like enzyme
MKQAIIRIFQRLGFISKPERSIVRHRHDNYSPQLGRNIVVDVYLPGDFYEDMSKQYDILYINDGQDMEAVRLQQTVRELWQSGKIRRLLVIAMHANERRMREYGTAYQLDYKGRGDLADDYARFVTMELLPFMRDHYNMHSRVNRRVFAGFSLGGLSAFDIVWNHPNLFHKVGVFSGSFWWRSQPMHHDPNPDANRIMQDTIARSEKRDGLQFWLQTGTLDENEDRNNNGIIDSIDDTQDIIKGLKALGYADDDICYREVEGGYHNQQTWAQVLPEFLEWAFER